jgi:hypothetical protein
MNRVGSETAAILEALHEQLRAQFQSIRRIRDESVGKRPLFALEHGLTAGELATLTRAVRDFVSSGRRPPESTWLPFVVYAAEIGYGYVGDEYWQTFETETPGWEVDDRYYIRRKFQTFSAEFGGAIPAGAWARHFSIICWPITHAVLPTDLQRQLARLLYEFRFGLTSELLLQPEELGTTLAARAWHTSSRFQNFAQNTDLLGQVATALLLPTDENSPYLQQSTLERIVGDLSRERQARSWLRDAKSRVVQIRTRGFLPREGGSRREGFATQASQIRTDPELLVELGPEGWRLMIRLPDMSGLSERLPGVHEELSRLRCRVAGIDGPPLARGRVLYPGQTVRLDYLPDLHQPLLQLENGSTEANNLLLDQCTLPAEPWLYRLNGSFGREIRGNLVRPGVDYLLVTSHELEGPLPSWTTPVQCLTEGAHTHLLRVPDSLDDEILSSLRRIGVGSATDVELWPAGLVPALWDGEGSIEWSVGDVPIVGIASTRRIGKAVLTVDGVPDLLTWPPNSQTMFVRLGDLEVGSHEVHVSLLPEKDGGPVTEGRMEVAIRPPSVGTQKGSMREGLALMSYPPAASLSEIWDGRASMEVRGPSGVSVRVECALLGQRDRLLTRQAFSTTLPIDPTKWLDSFTRNFRRVKDVEDSFDVAETCVISVSHPMLGRRMLRCEREFTPLRWSIGRRQGQYLARLINNTEESVTTVDLFPFETPADGTELALESDSSVIARDGGLLRAVAGGSEALVVLPPHVRDLSDLHRTDVHPQIQTGHRTAESVGRMLDLAAMWTAAVLAANPFAERLQRTVIQGITARLGGLIGGGYWWQLEFEALQSDDLHRQRLISAIGQHDWQQALARDLIDEATNLSALAPEKRCSTFADVVRKHVIGVRHIDSPGFAERLLRMGSSPGSLTGAPADELAVLIDRVLATPILFRAARLLVLSVHCMVDEDASNVYRGWAWP